ncbi:hypothetical protein DAEQUDRAFT_596795 [Daedalea quercina L-15889]|uniref:Uncharacterized protein n=1 Tax=Daedalea quercina L-15889 TaxID=1314783 RepID=A0A165SZE3_9APHY|nr:hypothetical protein DAEQUDRAFT_596795 [Daedalea quercina L-15889]
MDFSINGEQLPISSFFTQRSGARSQKNKRRADQGDKTESAPSKRSKNKGPLSDSAGTSIDASKESGNSRARSKPTKANTTAKQVDDVFRDQHEGIRASCHKGAVYLRSPKTPWSQIFFTADNP